MVYLIPNKKGIFIADGTKQYKIRRPLFSLWKYRNLRQRSVIVGFVGARGSGKSVGADRLIITDFMLRGKTVWSNMDVRFNLVHDNNVIPMRSIPLDRMNLNDLDRVYFDGVIYVDEINLMMDARRAMSRENVNLSYILQQLRKRRLNILWSAQSEMHCDDRLRFQTDIFIQCEDVSVSKPQCGIGELSSWRAHDYSGIIKGKSPKNSEEATFYRGVEWNKPWWNTYNTWQLQENEVKVTREGEEENENAKVIAAKIAGLMANNTPKVKKRDMWKQHGVTMRKVQIQVGQILSQDYGIYAPSPTSDYWVTEE